MSLWTAFVLGLFGSLHCAGMCGPIVLVLPRGSGTRAQFIVGRALHLFGKAITYAFLGSVAGAVGQTIVFAGYQQWLGIISGTLMIGSVVLPAIRRRPSFDVRLFPSILSRVKTSMASFLGDGSSKSLFLIGILNGFLPCGLVYTALAASLAAGGIALGGVYMFLFGVGTGPLLIGMGLAGGITTHALRSKITRVIPVSVFLLGTLFILRGMALGIPYVSPLPPSAQTVNHASGAGHDCCKPGNRR